MLGLPDISGVVASALAEDLGVEAGVFLSPAVAPCDGPDVRCADLLARDVTTSSVLDVEAARSTSTWIIAPRVDCVVCGLPVAAAVFETLSRCAPELPPVRVSQSVEDGAWVLAGTAVAEIEGPAAVVLAAERTALDFVMVLSGIATETHRWVEAAAGSFDVCDTRKTVPGLRALSKYAVRAGGGVNHRMGLYDMVLIKDNHLCQTGGIAEAIGRAREHAARIPVEVEAETATQAAEAARAGADIIMLDNLAGAQLAAAVEAARAAAAEVGHEVVLEASGNLTFARLQELRGSGIDRVSSSALTMAAPVDFGLDDAVDGCR